MGYEVYEEASVKDDTKISAFGDQAGGDITVLYNREATSCFAGEKRCCFQIFVHMEFDVPEDIQVMMQEVGGWVPDHCKN